MRIKCYTGNMLEANATGNIDISNAPLPGVPIERQPKHGFLAFYTTTALSVGMNPSIIEARKKALIYCPMEITVNGLERSDPHGKEINISTMKLSEFPFCELINLSRLSTDLRDHIINQLVEKYSVDHLDKRSKELISELKEITSMTMFIDFFKNNPSVVDDLHAHSEFKHVKAIIFPVKLDIEVINPADATQHMVSMVNLNPEDIIVKTYGSVKDINFVVSSRYTDNRINATNEISNEFQIKP